MTASCMPRACRRCERELTADVPQTPERIPFGWLRAGFRPSKEWAQNDTWGRGERTASVAGGDHLFTFDSDLKRVDEKVRVQEPGTWIPAGVYPVPRHGAGMTGRCWDDRAYEIASACGHGLAMTG